MIRSNFTDWIKKYIPQPTIPETKGILKTKPKDAKDFEDDGLDDDDIEALEKASSNENLAVIQKNWEFIDLTKEKRTKERGEAKGKRKWETIKGITLHQTAVDFGTNPLRMLNVPVHGATLKDGKIVLLHTPTDYMWHCHAGNKSTIGIEVSCRAAGILGNPDTFWMSSKEVDAKKTYEELVKEATEIQIEATIQLVEYYIKLVKENGGEIEFIASHRQFHKSRISDPGEKIWKGVAIPMMEKYNLSNGPKPRWTLGSGTPTPQAWDPKNGKGVPYDWKVKGF